MQKVLQKVYLAILTIDFVVYFRSGVYHSWLCSQTRLDHGVLAVGYGKDDGKDYWLVKNRYNVASR